MKAKVMLDSGAYTAHRKGKQINLEAYAEFVKKYQSEFFACFNLDSIGSGKDEQKAKSVEGAITTAEQSYLNWRELQSMGVNTIPIYHLGTNVQWLKKYLKETDYIAIGAIANLNTTKRLMGLSHIWKNYLTNADQTPRVKVHGLGLTAVDIMIRYPWYSVDSFTPVISAVWGSILLPKLDNKGEPHFFNMTINKVSDQGDHKDNMENSYLNVPERNKKVNQQMFEDEGFELGEIAYQVKRDRRGKKGEQERKPPKLPGFDLVKPSNPDVQTLANSWEIRMKWNLIMWNHLRERLPVYPRSFIDVDDAWDECVNNYAKTNMFMGVSTLTHLEIFSMIKPKLDILISYAYMTEGIHKSIKNYVK
jgi:hypothetical protein